MSCACSHKAPIEMRKATPRGSLVRGFLAALVVVLRGAAYFIRTVRVPVLVLRVM